MHKTTIYLPEDLKHAMTRLAQARGVSAAELVREALQAFTEAATPPRPRLPLFKSGRPGLADNFEDAIEGFGQS